MPVIVAIVGKGKTGKTTLIEKLIKELKTRGYRVATVKHVFHHLAFDQPDKDSWRHIEAGSEATIIRSEDRMVLIKPITPEVTLEEVARVFGEDYDIVIAEGFKQSDAPKIEVHRKEKGTPLTRVKKLFAIATDEPLATSTRQFSLDDVKGLADLLEEGFIRPNRERLSLYVNDVPIALSGFPRDIISNILISMASSLKGVGVIKKLEFILRKRD